MSRGISPTTSGTYPHYACVCCRAIMPTRTLTQENTMSDLNAKVLAALEGIQANLELVLAQGGVKHQFIQPKAETNKAKTKVEATEG